MLSARGLLKFGKVHKDLRQIVLHACAENGGPSINVHVGIQLKVVMAQLSPSTILALHLHGGASADSEIMMGVITKAT